MNEIGWEDGMMDIMGRRGGRWEGEEQKKRKEEENREERRGRGEYSIRYNIIICIIIVIM